MEGVDRGILYALEFRDFRGILKDFSHFSLENKEVHTSLKINKEVKTIKWVVFENWESLSLLFKCNRTLLPNLYQ